MRRVVSGLVPSAAGRFRPHRRPQDRRRRRVQQVNAVAEPGEALRRDHHGVVITIDAHDPQAWVAFAHRCGVTTEADGRVHQHRIASELLTHSDHLIDQHGVVSRFTGRYGDRVTHLQASSRRGAVCVGRELGRRRVSPVHRAGGLHMSDVCVSLHM